jgi:hypothetical protein
VSLDVTRGEKKSDSRMYNQLTKGMTAMLSDGELKTAIKNGCRRGQDARALDEHQPRRSKIKSACSIRRALRACPAQGLRCWHRSVV